MYELHGINCRRWGNAQKSAQRASSMGQPESHTYFPGFGRYRSHSAGPSVPAGYCGQWCKDAPDERLTDGGWDPKILPPLPVYLFKRLFRQRIFKRSDQAESCQLCGKAHRPWWNHPVSFRSHCGTGKTKKHTGAGYPAQAVFPWEPELGAAP